MNIGIPKEVKNHEYRVGMLPGNIQIFTDEGHKVFVEKGAGLGVGIVDEAYVAAGATVLTSAEEVWSLSDMIIKVKEPTKEEYSFFKEGLILFTFLHLASEPELTEALCAKGVVAIAYETIQLADGSLPLLHPMSEASGRLSPQIGAHLLEKNSGGKGILLGGVTGIHQGHVVILGAGVVGRNAAMIATGLGAKVTILDINVQRLSVITDIFGSSCATLLSHRSHLTEILPTADLLISGVLVAGAKSPTVVTEDMVKSMQPGSVVIDVAIDQGGSVATMKPTTHDQPTFTLHQVVHYGVTNIPGCVPRTTTHALTNVTFPYAIEIASRGLTTTLRENPALCRGLNTSQGQITHPVVAESLGKECYEFFGS
ncbi:MAG: alanine dehydrogenase [Proteobacteria bacterium]|nr:alanine dehydrogenase [Pseudomonadota bacterium]